MPSININPETTKASMIDIDTSPLIWVIACAGVAVAAIAIVRIAHASEEKKRLKMERDELLRPGREAARAARMKRKNR